jgi:hypothetical protein
MSVMDKVMYFATREKDKGVNAAATAVYGMLLRALISSAVGSRGTHALLAASSGVEAAESASNAALCARQALDGCIKEVFEKKKTRWGCNDLGTFIKRAPDTLPELLLLQLLNKVHAARSEFLQVEALRLCNMCLRYVCSACLRCSMLEFRVPIAMKRSGKQAYKGHESSWEARRFCACFRDTSC